LRITITTTLGELPEAAFVARENLNTKIVKNKRCKGTQSPGSVFFIHMKEGEQK